jgi:hypothetical protein
VAAHASTSLVNTAFEYIGPADPATRHVFRPGVPARKAFKAGWDDTAAWAVIHSAGPEAPVRLERCKFKKNNATHTLHTSSPKDVFYSSQPLPVSEQAEPGGKPGSQGFTRPLRDAPAVLFLNFTDSSLFSAEQVLRLLLPTWPTTLHDSGPCVSDTRISHRASRSQTGHVPQTCVAQTLA